MKTVSYLRITLKLKYAIAFKRIRDKALITRNFVIFVDLKKTESVFN